MSIIRLIFVAALASFAVANVDEVSNDASFAEATAFVQSFSSTNEQGDSACLTVANDAIKVIADECKTLQVVINTAAQANQKCCKSGSLATCKAKKRHTSSIGAHSACLSQLDTIKNKNVNLGSVSYSSLARKTCNAQVVVPKNSQFKAIKSEVEKKTTECQKNSGIKATAKKFYEEAVKTAASSRTTCNEAAQAALTKAFTNGKAACGSATNLKAFTRAEHMKCVLKGTKLADCSMPKPPGVKKTTLSTLKCAAQTGHTKQCFNGHGTATYYLKARLPGHSYDSSFKFVTIKGTWPGNAAFAKCEGNGYKRMCDYTVDGVDSRDKPCVLPMGGHWHAYAPAKIFPGKSAKWKKRNLGHTCAIYPGHRVVCLNNQGNQGTYGENINGGKNLRVGCVKISCGNHGNADGSC